MPKFNTPSQETQDIGYAISSFYLNKNNQDYKNASSEVERLKITSIKVDDVNEVTIYLGRPGLLIGNKGQNIINLEKYLGKRIKIVESFYWDEILIPFDWQSEY